MAPHINDSISGGQARITPGPRTGSFEEQRKEAHTLAQMLRSGSLRGPWEKASVRQLA